MTIAWTGGPFCYLLWMGQESVAQVIRQQQGGYRAFRLTDGELSVIDGHWSELEPAQAHVRQIFEQKVTPS